MLQNGKVSKIWEMSIPQQTKYDRWSDKIIEMKMKCEKRQSKGKESKKIADLRKIKKKIRKNLGIQTEDSERSLQRQRLQMLTRHIEEEKLEQNTRKLVKTVESLQKAPGIISENTFWKFQQKQKNKLEEQKTAMKNKDGELVETEKEVKEVYTEFYKDLLSTSVASTQKEKLVEDNVNKLFRLIAENQEPLEITKDLVEIAIKKLKRKKAADEEKWTNEMIVEGGDEMVNSITYMFREISVTQQIPNQWKTMRIHKKGSKLLMDNKRGLFLTNILSKLYEKVIDLLTTEKVKINEHQCGGQKGCGTIDNMIMMRAVIDNNRRLNRKTYCYFADAYKCFDKLWLKDCLVELWRAGMREREVYMLYEMNKESHIVIETPVGMTDSITVHEIVKQGTIFGPKLCSVATEKINGIGEEISTHITPELTIGAPVYVDDILGIGDCKTVEKVIRNTRRLEEDKKFRFSRKKSKYMVIKVEREKLKR